MPQGRPGPLDRAERILFVRTDRLGETILNLPAVTALRAAWPQASVTMLVSRELQPLLERWPQIDHVVTYDPGARAGGWTAAIRLSRQLRQLRFQVAIVSNPKKEFHLAIWLAGIPCRVGYDRKWDRLLTHRVPERKAIGDRHEVEYNLDLVRALGLSPSTPQWSSPQFSHEQDDVRDLLQPSGCRLTDPLLIVHPWSSHPAKEWPASCYRALLRQLLERVPAKLVVIGSPQPRERIEQIVPTDASIANLVGRTSLPQLAALLQRATLLISGDSGPVHLSSALGTRTVALFGTTNPATGPGRWGPWGPGHVVIWKPSMDSITVDEVVEATQQQWQAVRQVG